MAYTKTNWVARQGTNLNKFNKSAETATSVIMVNAPELITVPGTPYSVENMNKLEQGVYDAHQMAENNYNMFHHVGKVEHFLRMPTPAQLATWRMLPLQGQVISVVQYAELCDAMWVGAAANATAEWWYRTSDAAGTVRDPNGAYMRVLDIQGLFLRAAGQNSKYKMASDAPYDGMGIGAYREDRFQIHAHEVHKYTQGSSPIWEAPALIGSGPSQIPSETAYLSMIAYYPMGLGTLPLRAGSETAPATISALFCIAY
jgi:hypothetical protein